MPVQIPVKHLKALCNPYGTDAPWGTRITQQDVALAIQEGRLASEPGGEDHPARIAYLVLNPATDHIQIDVGCPALGYAGPKWPILDGNHRFAAAIFKKAEFISGTVDGELGHAFELFKVDCEEPGATLQASQA